MRYGDCDVHSMEIAMLLIHLDIVDAHHVHMMNDQKWEHTFVKITPHDKCPFTFVIDAWSDNIASNPFSLKKYHNTEKLSNGEPALKHEVLAEKFLRNPNNIKNFGNIAIKQLYYQKITPALPSHKK